MNTDPGSIFKGFFVELWPFLAVEFWSRCWILTPSWVAIPRVEDMQAGQNSTLNCDPGSKFHVDLWPRDKFSRWIMTPGQNSILNFDPNSRSEFNVESWIGVTIQRWIQTWGYNLTLNQELGSIFNVEYWPGSDFNVESWPGSQFNMELKPRIKIPHWIMTPGQNSTLNCDPNPGSQFNVESRLRVIIQRGNKTRGHNSMGVQILSVGGVVKQWPPVSGGSQFIMKNPLNPEHNPLNQDPTGRNSMGSKFNPTPAHFACNSKTMVFLSYFEYLHIQCINRYTCISLCTAHLYSNISVLKWETYPLAMA